MNKLTIKIISLALLVRLLVAPFFYHPDLKTQHYHFQFLSHGVTNIYEFLNQNRFKLPYTDTFNYLPLTYLLFGSIHILLKPLYLPDFYTWLNDWGYLQHAYLNLPYFILILKIPYFILDFLTAFLLWKMYHNQKLVYLWLFNPISIYLIYIQGNFDILPAMLTLLSFYLLSTKTQTNKYLSFLILGFSVSLKLYPILFLPILLLKENFNLKKYITYTFITIIPLLATCLPFIGTPSFINSFFGSGLTQKAISTKFLNLPLFPLAYFFILTYYYFHKKQPRSFEKNVFLIFVAFVSLVPFHAQWLTWFFPFVLIVYYYFPKYRLVTLIIFLLCFLYIILFNDLFLSLGHFIAIDSNFYFTFYPYQYLRDHFKLDPKLFQIYIRYFILLIFSVYELYESKK